MKTRLILLLAALSLCGCAQSELQVQATVASGVAAVANVSLDMLVGVYEADLLAALKQAAIDEDASAAAQHRSTNRQPALDAAMIAVNKSWIPIWGDPSDGSNIGAWEVFRALQATWATQIEAGQAKSALGARVNAAYCSILVALPEKYRAMITIPLIPCPAQVTP